MRYGRLNSALPVFDPISSLKTQYRPLRIIRDYFRHQNNILFFCVFKFICSSYIIISYITSRYLLFDSPKRGQNISKKAIVLRDCCPVSHQTWKDLVWCPLSGALILDMIGVCGCAWGCVYNFIRSTCLNMTFKMTLEVRSGCFFNQ